MIFKIILVDSLFVFYYLIKQFLISLLVYDMADIIGKKENIKLFSEKVLQENNFHDTM